MEEFAKNVHEWAGGYLTDPVVDSTGLKGSWDFDIKWTPRQLLQKAGPDGISIFDAVDKELGLKLDRQTQRRGGFVQTAAEQQNIAEIILSRGPLRAQRHRFLTSRQRRFDFAPGL